MTSAWFVAGLGATTISSAVFHPATGAARMTVATALLGFDYPGTNPWSLLLFYPFFFNPRSGRFFLKNALI